MDPELPDILALLQGQIEPATADSIFAAIGAPALPVVPTVPSGLSGVFTHDTGQIGLKPKRGNRAMSQTLVHEIGHQHQHRNTGDKDFEGFANRFQDRFDELPVEGQVAALEHYLRGTKSAAQLAYREHRVPIRSLFSRKTKLGQHYRNEVMSEALAGGFNLFRQMTPDNKDAILQELEEQDKLIPGTREAFNLFQRKLR
jgi:hypothetical protein